MALYPASSCDGELPVHPRSQLSLAVHLERMSKDGDLQDHLVGYSRARNDTPAAHQGHCPRRQKLLAYPSRYCVSLPRDRRVQGHHHLSPVSADIASAAETLKARALSHQRRKAPCSCCGEKRRGRRSPRPPHQTRNTRCAAGS